MTLEAQGTHLVKGGDDNGDIYINGVADGDFLGQDELSLFVLRMTRNYELVFYSKLDVGSNPVGGMMLLDSSTLYNVFGYSVEVSATTVYRWGLVAFSTEDGTIQGSDAAIITLADGDSITRDPSRGQRR